MLKLQIVWLIQVLMESVPHVQPISEFRMMVFPANLSYQTVKLTLLLVFVLHAMPRLLGSQTTDSPAKLSLPTARLTLLMANALHVTQPP